MKITKKIMSVVLAAIMVISALAVSVSAESIYDTAVDLPSGEKQSFTFASLYDAKDYKITLSKKGTMKINVNAYTTRAYLYVYDSEGNNIECKETNFTTGNADIRKDYVFCSWNKTTENFKGTAEYELEKGTYYIRFKRDRWSDGGFGSGKATLTASYGSDDSSSGKISYLTLEMEVGDTIRLGTVTEPADADVKWSTSKSKVATVSASGKVTAKKEGSAIITAKSGSSVKKIKIIVV